MDTLLEWTTIATAEDKTRTDRIEKKYIIEQMARQCGLGEKLVDYWMRLDTKVPEATSFSPTSHCLAICSMTYFFSTLSVLALSSAVAGDIHSK